MKYLKKSLVSGATLVFLLGGTPVSADTVVHTDRASGVSARIEAAQAARQKAEQHERMQAEERARQQAKQQARMREERKAELEQERADREAQKARLEADRQKKTESMVETLGEQQPQKVEPKKTIVTAPQMENASSKINDIVRSNASQEAAGKKQVAFGDITGYQMYTHPRTPFNTSLKQKALSKLTKGVRINHDDMSNITYYIPKKVSADPITLYPVIIYNHDNNTVSIEFIALFVNTKTSGYFGGVSSTTGDDHHLWFDTVTVRADNKRYVMKYDFTRGHQDKRTSQGINTWWFGSSSVSVIEYYEEVMDANAFSTLQAITRAKDVKVRFSGKDFQVDKEMSDKKIAIEKRMLDIYELLKS